MRHGLVFRKWYPAARWRLVVAVESGWGQNVETGEVERLEASGGKRRGDSGDGAGVVGSRGGLETLVWRSRGLRGGVAVGLVLELETVGARIVGPERSVAVGAGSEVREGRRLGLLFSSRCSNARTACDSVFSLGSAICSTGAALAGSKRLSLRSLSILPATCMAVSVGLAERSDTDALPLLAFFCSFFSGMLFVPKVWGFFILAVLGVVLDPNLSCELRSSQNSLCVSQQRALCVVVK